jgi:hypothetical protein
VLCTNVPLCPVTVTVYVPAGVLEDVTRVRVLAPDPATEVGEKAAEAPEGNPLAEKLTVPVKPPTAVTETLEVVLPPAVTVRALGLAETEKSGEAACGAKAGNNVFATKDPKPVTKS